jgi:hypothetical protein
VPLCLVSYAECRNLLIFILNVIMLSVIILSVIILSVVILSVVMVNVVAPSSLIVRLASDEETVHDISTRGECY